MNFKLWVIGSRVLFLHLISHGSKLVAYNSLFKAHNPQLKMNLLKISTNNLKDKPLTTFLSILLMALGIAIISLLLLAGKQIEEKFSRNVAGIDMVVGAKGSPLQLILASIYQVD